MVFEILNHPKKPFTSYLQGSSSEALDLIREKLSVADKNVKFYKSRYAPSRKYLIRKGTLTFDHGVRNLVVEAIKKHFPFAKIVTQPYNDYHQLHQPVDITLYNREPYYYQKEAYEAGIKCVNGIIKLPTSSGKTTIIGLLCKHYQQCLDSAIFILVPNIGLVNQTTNDLKEYGISSVYPLTGQEKDFNYQNFQKGSIIIANSSVVLARLDKLAPYLRQVSALIVDEVHTLGAGNKINNIFKYLQTNIRIGLTGTLPPEENKLDLWNVFGKIGPVIYTRESEELRQENYIANVQCKALHLQHDCKTLLIRPSTSPIMNYRAEMEYLSQLEERSRFIMNIAFSLSKNTLILVDRIKAGEILKSYEAHNQSKHKVYFIQGSTPLEERQKIIDLMEQQNNIVCIAMAKIFSTGINIKNLHHIIFTCVGKSSIRVIQSIGRSLRLHSTKSKSTIFDIYDNFKYSLRHFEIRKQIYKQEGIPLEVKQIPFRYRV